MDDRLRVGVIGTGAIGREHVARIAGSAHAEVVALNDIDPASAQSVAADLAPNARVVPTGEELIAAADVDAVVVASWGESHEAYVLASLAVEKPCFCEKPLATEADGARRIVDAEVTLGRRLVQVGFMRRYDAGYLALKEAVDHRIGRPLMVHAAHRNPTVPGHYTTSMAITDTAIHEIDVLRWLLDDDHVAARVLLPRTTPHAPRDLIDPQILLLETAGGVRIDLEIFVNCRYGYDIQCEIVGEDGVARLPDPMAVAVRHDAQVSTPILTDWKDRFLEAYDTEVAAFLQAAARGEATGPSAWDGYVAALSGDACLLAQRSPGTEIAISTPERPVLYG